MVGNVVYLLGVELVQYGHRHGAIGECGQIGHRPVGTVAPAEGYLVALLYAAVFKQNMKFLYLARHVLVLKGDTLEVGEGIVVPVAEQARF